MQVIIINKHYMSWEFKSIKGARPFIDKGKREDYFIKRIDGQSVRVYCLYDCTDCRCVNCKYRRA